MTEKPIHSTTHQTPSQDDKFQDLNFGDSSFLGKSFKTMTFNGNTDKGLFLTLTAGTEMRINLVVFINFLAALTYCAMKPE